MLKTCPRCGDQVPLEEFARDRSKASGYASRCKACDREKARRYYEANRERKLAYMAERTEALREARGWQGRRQRWSMAPPGRPSPKCRNEHVSALPLSRRWREVPRACRSARAAEVLHPAARESSRLCVCRQLRSSKEDAMLPAFAAVLREHAERVSLHECLHEGDRPSDAPNPSAPWSGQ
jgi:hypothetical protein